MLRSTRYPSLFVRLALVAAFLFVGTTPVEAATDNYVVDKGHSAVMFKIKHLGVSYTYGRFNEFSGTFAIDDANLKNAKVELDIHSDSIDTNNADRDKHLRSKDYFDCENHPSITFESTAVEKAAGNVYRVTGNLTLLGKTKSVTLRMTKVGEGKDPWGNYRMGFDGQVVIKRSDFGMTAMLKGIGDEVRITLGVEGIRKDPNAGKKKK